ncbi:MAG: signal peptidase I, partial [bacterium]
FLKRVIGLPGDKIRVDDTQIYVNDTPINEPYLNKPDAPFSLQVSEVTVPEGRLFVAGDNRPYSDDSRYWLYDGMGEKAFVKESDLAGKPFLIYWPLTHFRFLFGYRISVK